MHSYSPSRKEAAQFASELELEFNNKKRTNKKWISYLIASCAITSLLIGLIIFFAVDLEKLRDKTDGKDECGRVFVEDNLRIIHGVEAIPHSWPAQVLLMFEYYVANFSLLHPNTTFDAVVVNKTFSILCGGTLINRWTVMTASHCIKKIFDYEFEGYTYKIPVEPNEFYPTYESMYTIYLGAHRISDIYRDLVQYRKVAKIIMHEGYDHNTVSDDITLLKLQKNADLNEKVQIACLPDKQSDSFPSPWTKAYISGWGYENANIHKTAENLQNTVLSIVNDSLCAKQDPLFKKGKLCAGDFSHLDTSVCHGDSGGGLYIKDQVSGKMKFVTIGIASYGYVFGNSDYYQFFTRVSIYLDWIKAHFDER